MELLVVVAIIALLIAVLVPAVGSARESSKTVSCGNNMRQIAEATHTFAAENDGRGPADCSGPKGETWPEILDAEVFARPATKYGVVRLTPSPNAITLTCPNFEFRKNAFARAYAMNEYVGGFISGSNKVTDDPSRHIAGYYDPNNPVAPPRPPNRKIGDAYSFATYSGTGAVYNLGTKLSRFAGNQILLVEHNWGNDWYRGDDNPIVFNRDAPTPQASAPGYDDWHIQGSTISTGLLSFRHPYFGKANFARFDGGVEVLGKNDGGSPIKRYASQ